MESNGGRGKLGLQIDGCRPLVRGESCLSTWKQNMAYRISFGFKMLIKGSPCGELFYLLWNRIELVPLKNRGQEKEQL